MEKSIVEYNEEVLTELESIGVDKLATILCEVGMKPEDFATFISLMMRASFLERKSPEDAALDIASQLTKSVIKVIEDVAMEILLTHGKFPSE